MITIESARSLSAAANAVYTVEYVSEFIEERAKAGSRRALFDTGRWTGVVDVAIKAAGFTVIGRPGAKVEVTW